MQKTLYHFMAAVFTMTLCEVPVTIKRKTERKSKLKKI